MTANKLANEGIVTQLAVVHTMLPKVKELIDNQVAEIKALKSNPAFYEIVVDNHWVMRLWSNKLVNGHTWELTSAELLEFVKNISKEKQPSGDWWKGDPTCGGLTENYGLEK